MQKNRERIGKVTEVNKAKEYLLQVSRAEHRIKRLKEEILSNPIDHFTHPPEHKKPHQISGIS